LRRTHSSLRAWHCRVLLVLCLTLPALARVHRSESWARAHFSKAESMREALNGRPAEQRTRREYLRVIDSYRLVYFGSPTSTRADPSVVASAELMVEMGRRFHSDSMLRSAIQQYEFLRREYPGSKYRFEALFTIGEIYKDDLNDPERAKATFREFLRRYPRNHLAEDARNALAEPGSQPSTEARAEPKNPPPDTDRREQKDGISEKDLPPATAAADTDLTADNATPARVTGIRHWSTPDYTRVAIDIEQDIPFSSHRIAHPDRIFFDLTGTRLASTLVGKTLDVDDGFLKKIRVAQFQPGKTRIVLEVDDIADYDAFMLSNPTRLIIDIHGQQAAHAGAPARTSHPDGRSRAETPFGPVKAPTSKAPQEQTAEASETAVGSKTGAGLGIPAEALSPGQKSVKVKVVEPDEDNADDVTATKLDPPESRPARPGAVSPLSPSSSRKSRASATNDDDERDLAPELDAREARPTARGDRSLTRALGLKIGKIVIDPGHGGHDTGTIGPNGLKEKDLVLEVSKRLGRLLETRLGAEVVYTRKDDTFIPLETRTAIANQQRADLFVSVHANSSGDPDARGVETYYLNFTSSADALEVAARENAVSDKSIYELQDLVKKIALKEKIEESREFAADVQNSLYSGLEAKAPGLRNRGVKKAPFIVLIGANMPSILAEISFVSNPEDERRLKTAEYRQRIAESFYRGIAKYASGLSGVRVASKIDKEAP
jgi:N-acetylmuramoyl-L-alanine amidase